MTTEATPRFDLDTTNGYQNALQFVRGQIHDAYSAMDGFVPADADTQFDAVIWNGAIYNSPAFDDENMLIAAKDMDEFRQLWAREIERFREDHPDMTN